MATNKSYTLSELKTLCPEAAAAALADPLPSGARYLRDASGCWWELGETHCAWQNGAWGEDDLLVRCEYCYGWLAKDQPGTCYTNEVWHGPGCTELSTYRQAAHDVARNLIEDQGYDPNYPLNAAAYLVLNANCVSVK